MHHLVWHSPRCPEYFSFKDLFCSFAQTRIPKPKLVSYLKQIKNNSKMFFLNVTMLSFPFQESKCMLLTYFVLLFLLFVILLVGGILGYVFRQQVKMFCFFYSSEIIQLDYWKNRTSQLLRYCTCI